MADFTGASMTNGTDRLSGLLRNSGKPCPLLKRGDGTSNLIEFIEWIEPIMVQQFGNLALVLRTKQEYVPKDYYYETGDDEKELSAAQDAQLKIEALKLRMQEIKSLKRNHRPMFTQLLESWACTYDSRVLIEAHPNFMDAYEAGDPNKLVKIIYETHDESITDTSGSAALRTHRAKQDFAKVLMTETESVGEFTKRYQISLRCAPSLGVDAMHDEK